MSNKQTYKQQGNKQTTTKKQTDKQTNKQQGNKETATNKQT